MRRKHLAAVIIGCLFGSSVFADPNTQIRYDLTDLGPGRWEYTYEVSNINLAVPIEEFTIWFDYGLYQNLLITTPDPPAGNWDEIVWQPEPLLWDDGGYDAIARNHSIGVGENVHGFSVSFDWVGQGEPGPQHYEIVNPVTYNTIVSGYTVPEPLTVLLLGMGALIVHVRLKS